MMTLILSNHCTSKVVRGFNFLAIPTHFVLKPLELSQTMRLLGSIDLGFYPTWTFRAHATITPSNRGNIPFTSVKDLMGTGTQEKIH